MKSFTQRWREASDEAEDQPMEDTPTDPKEAPDDPCEFCGDEDVDCRVCRERDRKALEAERDEYKRLVDCVNRYAPTLIEKADALSAQTERADRLQAERDEANESVDFNYKTILALREQIEELKRDNYEVRRERDQAIELRNQRTAELDAVRKEWDAFEAVMKSDNESHVQRCYKAEARNAELEKLIQDAGHEECCPYEFGEPCECWKSRLTPAPPEEKRP